MPRPKGSKNKKTLEREMELLAQEQVRSRTGEGLVDPAGGRTTKSGNEGTYRFAEYTAPDGAKWRVERADGVMELFGISLEEFREWHRAFAGASASEGSAARALPASEGSDARGPAASTGSAWRLLRLAFGIAPLVGEVEAEYLSPHPDEAIAAKLGITTEQVRKEVEEAVLFWRKWKEASERTEGTKRTQGTESQAADTDAEICERLRKNGFPPDLLAPEDRGWVAQRISDLQPYLASAESRQMARSAIQQELMLTTLDREILLLQMPGTDGRRPEGKADKIAKLLESRDKLQKSYKETMDSIGATETENPTIAKRRGFQDCLGTLVESVREYYAKGNRELVDGVFTAAEVQILIQPMSFRPPQYRLDIVALTNQALQEHNLFNADYEPPNFDRNAYRRFMKAFRDALVAGAAADGEIVELEDESEEIPEEQVVSDGEMGGGRSDELTGPAPVVRRPPNDDGDFVGVVM